MASASTWPSSAGSPSRSEPGRRAAAVPVFLAAAVLLGALCGLAVARGYLGDAALDHYARVLAAGAAGIEPGTFHRQGTLLLAQWFARLSGASPALLPYLLDILAGAGVLALLWRDLARAAGAGWAWTLSLAFLLQPLLLWAALSGDGLGMLLLAYHATCRLLCRLRRDAQPVAYLRLAAMLCVLFLLDARAWPLILALVPWMLLAVPPGLLRRAPLTFHLASLLPLGFVLLALLYAGLQAGGDPLLLLRAAWNSGTREPIAVSWPAPAFAWLPVALALAPPLLLAGIAPAPGAWRVPLATGAALLCAALAMGWLRPAAWPLAYVVLLLAPLAIALPPLAGLRRPAWALGLLLAFGVAGGGLLRDIAGPALEAWWAALRTPFEAPAPGGVR